MIDRCLITGVIGVILMIDNGRTNADEAPKTLTYPKAPRSDTIDDYHGTNLP
ncbi:MAG: hypothetical protein ACHRXM_08340 [Isosphaerales bacterium]